MNLILSHLTTVCVQWFCDSVGKVLVGSVRSDQSGLASHHFDPFFEKRITLILIPEVPFFSLLFFFSHRENSWSMFSFRQGLCFPFLDARMARHVLIVSTPKILVLCV